MRFWRYRGNAAAGYGALAGHAVVKISPGWKKSEMVDIAKFCSPNSLSFYVYSFGELDSMRWGSANSRIGNFDFSLANLALLGGWLT